MAGMIYELDGIVFDAETGEILEIPDGADDAVNLLVHRIKGWEEDAKTLQGYAAMFRDIVMRKQATKVERYGDLKVNVISGSRALFDIGGFRIWLAGAELTRDELTRLLLIAGSFDLSLLGDTQVDTDIAMYLGQFYGRVENKPYLRIDRIVQAPPRLIERERESVSA